jgi:hypothetical protein
MIQAIAPAAATPISEQSSTQIRADSLAVANLYGSSAAIVVPSAPLVYEAPFNPHLNDIAAVTRFARIVRPRNATGQSIDRYV